MTESGELLPLYLQLARASQQRNRPLVRDKLLVLAGATATERGLDLIAACCRKRILANNPGHLVGHYSSFAQALDDDRFQGYLAQLRRRYTRERAELMLGSLGIDAAREHDGYFTLFEYAAALLDTSPAELVEIFGDLDEAADEAQCGQGPRNSPSGLAEAGEVRSRGTSRAWPLAGAALLALLSATVLLAIWRLSR
jgi:hypothetical protein